jgi:hypothetical protein
MSDFIHNPNVSEGNISACPLLCDVTQIRPDSPLHSTFPELRVTLSGACIIISSWSREKKRATTEWSKESSTYFSFVAGVVPTSDYTASNDWMAVKKELQRMWEGISLLNFKVLSRNLPISLAARSKAWTTFARSKAGIMGSNPTQGRGVCVCCSVCR